MMVAYLKGATSGIDPALDGKFFNDSPIALNSFINNEEFVIQAKGLPFEDTDIIPLTFKTNTVGGGGPGLMTFKYISIFGSP